MRRGRAVPWLRANWWVLIIGAVGVVLAFGISGFAIAEPRESFIDRLYATLQLFVLEWNGGPNPPARLRSRPHPSTCQRATGERARL